MGIDLIFITLLVFAAIFMANFLNQKIAKSAANSNKKPSCRTQASLPKHYSRCFLLWSSVLSLAILVFCSSFVFRLAFLLVIFGGNFFLLNWLSARNFNAKKHLEKLQIRALSLTAGIGIIITLLIISTILIESAKFFKLVPWQDFLFGTNWQPQMAGSEAAFDPQEEKINFFGAIPVFVGSLLITTIAILIAFPVGIMAAIYLANYCKESTRNLLKPAIEVLAGVPTVVYGYFAVTAVAPFFKNFFGNFGLEISAESALAAGFVMGIMIIPSVLSMADDAFNAVPKNLKDGALALGSTKSEMIVKVAIPSAMPGLISALILAVSRAIGETMIVVMAAGLVAKMTFNPLDSVTTATVQIVSLLTGDQEFNSPKTLSAFALALTLFMITFVLNLIALKVSKNFEKKYG